MSLADRCEDHGLRFSRIDLYCAALLTLQIVALALLADPFRAAEFPINDDWAYIPPVKEFLQAGRWRIPDWTAANYIGMIPLGAFFGQFAEVGYATLRVSGWVALCGAALALYGAARELSVRPAHATLAVATLSASPLLLVVANSFMTDLPFMFAANLALWAGLRHCRTRTLGSFLAFVVALWAALSLRQSALAFSVALGAALIAGWPRKGASWLLAAGLVAAVILPQMAYEQWLKAGPGLPVMFGNQIRQLGATLRKPLATVLSLSASRAGVIVLYVSLLGVMAVLLNLLISRRNPGQRWLLVGTLLLGALLSRELLARGLAMPLVGYDLDRVGLGMRITGRPEVTSGIVFFWRAVTVLSVGAASYVALRLLANVRRQGLAMLAWRPQDRAFAALLVVLLGVSAAPLLGVEYLFDRYTLPLAAPFILLLLWQPRRLETDLSRRWLAALGVVVVLGTAVAGMALGDYMAWNRARWQSLAWLQAQGIDARRIDGGFEFNGSVLYSRDVRTIGPKGWFVADDEYVVTPARRSGYRVIHAIEVPRRLPFGPQVIYTLQREPSGGT